MREKKKRIGKATSDMSNPKLKHTTALTTHVWELKKMGKDYNVTWEVLMKAIAYSKQKKCKLCKVEKVAIMVEE